MTVSRARLAGIIVLVAVASLLTGTTGRGSASRAPAIHVGAVFPLQGSMSPLAREEYRGVSIAQQFVNADGGAAGREIVLDTRNLEWPSQASAVMGSLHRQGIQVVLGAYSSALSIPASAAAARAGMVYWEAGAVADRLTGQGFPSVFRVGASGSNLGANSARFAASKLAPRLGKQPAQIRIAVVAARDAYASSVANAAIREARAQGMQVVALAQYDDYAPDWASTIRTVKAAHPDVLILASHIPDGVAFRRAFLAAHLHVGAFIGSTMAQCVPEFGALMGKDAVGVFASDRPGGGFNPRALAPAAHSLYARLAREWRRETGQTQPSEEALAGFSAAWVLFHHVLPMAARNGLPNAAHITRAARALNLPRGTLPNGAGVRFAGDRQHLGQNLRAAAVIWQWQGIRHSLVVWPAIYATGRITMVPLPR